MPFSCTHLYFFKKGFHSSSLVEKKDYCISSVIAFLYFNSNVCKRLPKNAKNSCQIALFSSKTATESHKPYTVFSFDLQPCVKIRLYKVCKCLTALLTVKETRLKDPSYR